MSETMQPKQAVESRYDFARKYREDILKCSRCGYCQAVCPAFGATLRPSLNARGKMLILKEIMDGELELSEDLVETLCQCTTCGACFENCPSGVNVPEIIKAARKDLVHIGSCHPAFTAMNDVLAKHDNIYMEAELPDFDDRPRDRKGAENLFYVGCVGNFREDEATENTLTLLDRLGVDYTLVTECCCSGVLNDVGFATNPELAGKNIEALLAVGAKRLICGCPYCYRTFTHDPAYKALAERLEIVHVVQFLAGFHFDVKTEDKVTYHDSCDLGRHCGIFEAPRQIIRQIAEDFVEMDGHHAKSLCCGAGGGMRGAFARNSVDMARRRYEQALATGADVLLTGCNMCVGNLSNAKKRADKTRIVNMVTWLNELLDEAE